MAVSINSLLNQPITVEKKSGETNKYGQPSFDAPQTTRCRFERKERLIKTPTNEWEPIDGIVFVGPNIELVRDDRITYQGTEYRVMRSEPVVLGSGEVHHYELMVQRWSYNS